MGATCRQHRHVSEADTSREKGFAYNLAKASLDAQATSPGAVATTRPARHCLRGCALFREALDRVPRRCSGTPRGQPLVLPCWQARGDQHFRQDRGATKKLPSTLEKELWSSSRLRIVMTVASVSHSRPSSHRRCQTKWSSIPCPSPTTAHTKGNLEQDVQHETHDTGALLSVDGGSFMRNCEFGSPDGTIGRRFGGVHVPFGFFVFCPKKVHLAGVSGATPVGETCHSMQDSVRSMTTCQPLLRQLHPRAVEGVPHCVGEDTCSTQEKPWTWIPWHYRQTTWRRARAFRSLLSCAQKKSVPCRGPPCNSSGETCRHPRQCENYDCSQPLLRLAPSMWKATSVRHTTKRIGITQAHVYCDRVSRLSEAACCSAPTWNTFPETLHNSVPQISDGIGVDRVCGSH